MLLRTAVNALACCCNACGGTDVASIDSLCTGFVVSIFALIDNAKLDNAHILVWCCTEKSLSVLGGTHRTSKSTQCWKKRLEKTMAIVERTCFQRTASSRQVKRFTTTPWHDEHRSGNRSAV